MFISNINGVINKNLSLFFFSFDIKLAWKTKQKQGELTKNQLFFYFFDFFLKIQDIRKSKTLIFERRQHKDLWGQVLTIFQTGPNIVLYFPLITLTVTHLALVLSFLFQSTFFTKDQFLIVLGNKFLMSYNMILFFLVFLL